MERFMEALDTGSTWLGPCGLVGLAFAAGMGWRGAWGRKERFSCLYWEWEEEAFPVLGLGVAGEGDIGGTDLGVGDLGRDDGFVEGKEV